MMTNTLRRLITLCVSAIAGLAVLLALGCSFNFLNHRIMEKRCEGANDKAYAVLTGLLTTLIGLAVKLDSLEDPVTVQQKKPEPDQQKKPVSTRRRVTPKPTVSKEK